MVEPTKNQPSDAPVADEPAPAPAPKRYRLLARAQMHGAVRDAGYEFTLAEGELGPMRAIVVSDHGANHDGAPGELREEPLYVEVVEPSPAEPVEAEAESDEPPPAAAKD